MKKNKMHFQKIIFILSALLYGAAAGPAWAGFAFLDPRIPDGEMLLYKCVTGGQASEIREKIIMRKDTGRDIYEITSTSPTLDLVLRIAGQSMAVQSVDMVKKYNEVTLASKIEVIGEKPNAGDDEVKLVHYSVFKYLMRGFPFGEGKKLKVSYYGENPKKLFSMSVTCQKRETLTVGGKPVDCYRLEFGLDGFWSTFLPRSKLWYAVELPHYLVRHEGPSGPPGAPESTVELIERTVAPPAP
jgi:hypothetical protein